MSSSTLIREFRKSLYARLYYGIVDSDNLMKALSDEEIKTMIDTVSSDTTKIQQLKDFNEDKVSFISFTTPKHLESWFDRVKGRILEKYPDKDIDEDGNETYVGRQEKRGRVLAQQIRDYLKPQLQKDYPDNRKLESTILLDYIEREHGGNVKEIRREIRDYQKREETGRKERFAQSDANRKERRKILDEQNEKAAQRLEERKTKWEEQFKINQKNKKESYKLFESFLTNAAREKTLSSYKVAIDLINLVGSLDASSEKSVLRLKKFITERNLDADDKSKLQEILTALEKERKAYTKREGGKTKITSSAIQSKADGLAIGKDTKTKFNTSKTTNKQTSLRLSYGVGDFRTFSGKKRNVLSKFEKLDLRNNGWFNSNVLDEIPLYWIEKAGYKKGLDAWDKEGEDTKTEFIKKVANILPEYPMLVSDGVNMKSALEIIYNDIWDDYSPGNPSDPEDFAYFTQGIRDGLQNKSSTKAEDFLKLKEFKEDILPKLVSAVKKGIQVDENNKITYRLGPIFSKIMYSLGDSDERKQIIRDLIMVIKGQSLSTKYAGRNAAELKSLEDGIKKMVSEEIYGKTILSYILSTFLDIYKGNVILAELFKEEDTEVEVEYLKPSKTPAKEKPMGKKPKLDTKKKKGKQVPLMRRNINTGKREKVRRKDGSVIMVDVPTKRPEAGVKLRRWVDKETERLQEISDDEENDITYTEEEIHRRVGWKKETVTETKRNNMGIIRDKDGNPKTYKRTKYTRYKPGLYKNLEETKKSLDNLLIGMREPDDIIIKEDVGLILESLNKKQKKKVKAILNIADPTEYFGHDFLKLEDLVKVLKSLGVVKGDKKLNKKILKLENENLKVVKLATRLRKDYENLYRDLREMIYPKSGE